MKRKEHLEQKIKTGEKVDGGVSSKEPEMKNVR